MGRQIACLVTSIVVALLLFPVATLAQDDLDRSPEDCVRAERIRSTQVIGDRVILFHMSGNRVYLNELPADCPRLGSEGRFLYERRVGQRIGRLCSVDSITVIESVGASPYGATCRLGQFYPITQGEAADIASGRRSAEQIEVNEVDLPDEDEPNKDGDADE